MTARAVRVAHCAVAVSAVSLLKEGFYKLLPANTADRHFYEF